MQNYPVRATHRKNLATSELEAIVRAHFEGAQVADDAVVTSYGAISRLSVRPSGRDLSVDLTMNPKVSEDVARETIRRYNRFLEAATGYSAKERAKRLRKSASETGLGA